MKIIVAGCTGFIGAEVLQQALSSSVITTVVALSRRPLPDPVAKNPKLKTVIMEDFTKYPDSVLEELAGASGCAWALGLAMPKDMDHYRKVNVEYTQAAVNTFATSLAPQLGPGEKFRFAYCSGIAAERDQEKKLWFMQEGRRIRGDVENVLVQASKDHGDRLETYVLRPGSVLSKGKTIMHAVIGKTYSVMVDDLAAALLDSAMNGSDRQIEECFELALRGRKFVDAQASSKL